VKPGENIKSSDKSKIEQTIILKALKSVHWKIGITKTQVKAMRYIKKRIVFIRVFFVMATSLFLISLIDYASASRRKQMSPATPRITILYDAFGKNASMKKSWGFSAFIEINGKRILFDTGDNPDIFAQNVKAAGVDLTKLDFAIITHRHGDHMGGLTYLLKVNPNVKIFAPMESLGGVFGSTLHSSFYRKADELPPEMRYFDGHPLADTKVGNAWPGANFELIDQTKEVVPGMTIIALVSDAPGTKELKELSLAINTPQGIVLVVGCSHPGIDNIVAEASKINPHIHFIAGGLHLVVAPDSVVGKAVTSLKDKWNVDWIAPGHCTGEPAFFELNKAFGERYIYAGLGTVLEPSTAVTETPIRGK
jgi:7,8-dihydropterin-6-yl-methyl-4-(beta-D-ribofuranosyl)aminobenzene 5'-phosphate synthase